MKRASVVALAFVLAAGCGGAAEGGSTTTVTTAPPTTTTQGSQKIAVIADYSPTVSDVGGLMYLLLHPQVDVIAITLPPTGEAGCELGLDVTLRLLTLLDRTGIPVACDPAMPDDAKEWPEEFLRQSRNLLYLLPEPEAVATDAAAPDLITEVLAGSDRPVVIWAVAPLTNLARALEADPAAASHIDRIVVMGGAVDVAGNVFDSPAEWNLYIDPAAAAAVVASGVPITMVPLDATNAVPVPDWYPLALARSEQSPAIVHLGRLSRLFPILAGYWYFWDELAAAVITHPDVVTTEVATLSVVVGGAEDGRTVRDDSGSNVTIATAVPDANAFYGEFLGALSGAPAPVGRAPTDAEARYAAELGTAFQALDEAVGELFGAADDLDAEYDPDRAATIFAAIAAAGSAGIEAIDRITPPPSLQEAHDGFAAEFDATVSALQSAADRAHEVQSIDELIDLVDDDISMAACEGLRAELSLLGLEPDIPC